MAQLWHKTRGNTDPDRKQKPDLIALRRAYDIWERLSCEHPKVKRFTVMKEYTEKILGQQ